jgi:hypothetical protein
LTGFSQKNPENEPMPYVPPELKERLKREVSIHRLAEARSQKLPLTGEQTAQACDIAWFQQL